MFEQAVKSLSRVHILEPLKGAVSLQVLFVHPRLKAESKGRPERKYKLTRPDLSNLVKSLEDGLQGVVFNDDAQVVRIEAEKVYAALHEKPHIEITVEEVDIWKIKQMQHPNAGGEGCGLTHEDESVNRDLKQVSPHEERRTLTREERSEINRREHRNAQKIKHERMEHERKARKFDQAIIKLKETEERRKREAEEKKLRRSEEARQSREATMNSFLQGSSWMDGDDG